MAQIKKVPPGKVVWMSAETFNALADVANSWNNLEIEEITSSDERSRLVPSAARTVLRIVHPPVLNADGVPDGYELVTLQYCDGAGATQTGDFLMKTP